MHLVISPKSQHWFKEELGVEKGDAIRFFGKYGGKTDVHTGFSTGIEISKPEKPLVQVENEGIIYFIEESDEWFFGGYDLAVNFDEQHEEPSYAYAKSAEA